MKKMYQIIGVVGLSAILLQGCAGGPKPSKPNAKPTVYIQSHTKEKFKNITPEMAIWNGIPAQFLQNEQYMRCDMTDVATVVFVEGGFEVVTDKKDADYTLDTKVLSCGTWKAYDQNRMELPLQEKALYKDFMKWVKEKNPNKLPKDAQEIARLIQENKPEGFKRFHNQNYIQRYGQDFDYSENWGYVNKSIQQYMDKTNYVVLPNKYYGIKNSEKEILLAVNNKLTEADRIINTSTTGESTSLIQAGAGYSGGGNLGGALMGLGVLMTFFDVRPPVPYNEFKITNNRTGKSWTKTMHFSIDPQDWFHNKDKPMYDWTFDEIPWSELN